MQDTLTAHRDSRWLDALWLLLLSCLTGFYCVSSAAQISATFDEPFYLKAGLEAWRTGSTEKLMRAGTMPLPVDVQTGIVYAWEELRGEPFDLEADFDRILPWARAGNLLFWVILLVYSLLLGRYLAGPWAGRLAAGAVALDPNLLAHASLATTDIAITAAMVAFVYHYLRTRESGWQMRVGLMAVLYGFAVLTKASGMVFGPLCMVVLEAGRLWPHFREETHDQSITDKFRWLRRMTRQFRRDGVQVVLLGMVLVFAWCGCDYKVQKSFVKWADTLPAGSLHEGVAWFAAHLKIFPNAGEGLVYQIKHNFRGHGVYVLGDWYQRAVWYYFPITLLIKLSLPVLLLLSVALARPRQTLRNPIVLLVMALFAFSLNCRVQIGVRFMLPLMTFLLIWVSIAVIKSRPPTWPRPVRRGLVFASLLAMAVPSLLVWPNGLCYANQFWGGPTHAHQYLGDSSFDWGQGLPELAAWQEKHPEAPMHLWYFGTDPAALKPPHRRIELHSLNLKEPAEVPVLLKGNYLAVSATILFGNPTLTPSAAVALEALKGKQPVARTMTFFIYDFRD